LADYIVEDRNAHYHFTVKNNQPGLFNDIGLYFKDRGQPDFVLCDPPDHGRIENKCHYIIDWNFDEDRSRIRKGNGPENITRLRRFAVGVIKSKGVRSVAQKMRQLTRNVRLVFDYLAMTDNCRPAACRA